MLVSIPLLISILAVFSVMLSAVIIDNSTFPIGIDPVRPSSVGLLHHRVVDGDSKTKNLLAVGGPSVAPSASPSSPSGSPSSTSRPSTIAPSTRPSNIPPSTKRPRAAPSTIPSIIPSNPSFNPSASPSCPSYNPSISPSFRGGSLCAVKSTNPILYRNNANNHVMIGTVPIYIIWYGNWSTFKQAIITDFYGNLTNSDWMKILTTYYQANGQRPSASVTLSNQVTDLYSQGFVLQNPSSTTNIIQNQINSGALPEDPAGIYMIISSADVSAAVGSKSSCTHFCGFHSYYTRANAKKIKFGWVGDAGACMNTCGSQDWGPNGDAGTLLTLYMIDM